MRSYFSNIYWGIRTTWGGMRITLTHLWAARHRRNKVNIAEKGYFDESTGLMTVQFPHETIPLPDHGRNQLHNEMDDCIVCDKCAKICPVDCIEIEPIKATEEVGRASDGSPIRLYAAKFDIDMAKCCYCGLCTTVCPTECLTMTNEFEYSTFDVQTMLFNFGNLTPKQAEEKRLLWEQYQQEKEALKAATKAPEPAPQTQAEAPKRPVFMPKKPQMASPEPVAVIAEAPPKPKFVPKMKPKVAE